MSDVKGGRPNDRLDMSGRREPDAPAGRPLRWVMNPSYIQGFIHGGRWETENGHPGHCSKDHWHRSPEAALRCFKGGKP